MASHRYWRAFNLEAYDGGPLIALSEFWLLSGTTRVDTGATLTSSIAPVSGSVADLADNDTATDAVLARGTVFQWDFGGSPQDVSDIRLGSTSDAKRFPLAVRLAWSDDGVAWSTYANFYGITWPGIRTKTNSVYRPLDDSYISVFAKVDLSDVKGYRDDRRAAGWTAGSGVAIATGDEPFGSGAAVFNGTVNAYLESPALQRTADAWNVGPWTVEAFVKYLAWPANTNLIGAYDRSSGIHNWSLGADSAGKLAFPYYNGSSTQTVASAGAVLALNTWAHVAASHDSGTLRLLVNGTQVASAAVTGSPEFSSIPYVMGTRAGSALLNAKVKGLRMTREARYPGQPVYSFGTFIDVSMIAARSSPGVVGSVATQGAMPASSGASLRPALRARPNFFFNPAANGRIRGTVALEATPTDIPWKREVTLFRQVDKMPIQVQWSDAVTGEFDFQWIETDQAYFVYAEDYELNERGVVADNITLGNGMELMP